MSMTNTSVRLIAPEFLIALAYKFTNQLTILSHNHSKKFMVLHITWENLEIIHNFWRTCTVLGGSRVERGFALLLRGDVSFAILPYMDG